MSADRGKFAHCIRLVIADPQPIVLQGLRSVFEAPRDFEIAASCSSGISCLEAIRNLAPDVALVAKPLPDLTVSEILAIAKAENLSTRLVFAESEGDDDLTAAIAAGACSAVSKYANPDTMLRSVRLMTERTSASPKLSRDLSPIGKDEDGAKIEKMLGALTHRERQIVRLVSEGLSNKEIARQLNVSRGTVKVHLYNIFQKLEVSNRTVLAKFALLQRSTGFGTLSLAALAFAILSDAKASDTNDTFLHDDSTAHKDIERSQFELWRKAILRHIDVMDAGETVALAEGGSSVKVSQVTNLVARMEGLDTAEQAVLSNFGRGYGPIGSSAPYFSISPLLQGINNSQAGSPTTQQQLPPPEFGSKPMKSHGGYGTSIVTAAGAWIYTLENSHAAVQALDPGATPIDTFTVATIDGATQVATITIHGASNVGRNDGDSLVSGPVVHDSHPPFAYGSLGHDSITGEGNAGQIIHGGGCNNGLNGTGAVNVTSGNDTIKGYGGDHTISGQSGSDTIAGNNGNDTTIGGHGGDQLTGKSGDGIFVHSSATDSNSTHFDTIIDFISGEDKINLAAFGALAFLHMTSTGTFVPPHTLAWIYDPATNETIIYANPTDGSLHIGDPRLLEIHLQGDVSVAESNFVYEPEAAAVAAALGGIDPALLVATASDGTVLTAGSVHASIEATASESALGMAGVWAMPSDDGLRFHFGRDRISSTVPARPAGFGDDPDVGTDEPGDGTVMPVHVSSIEHIHATVLSAQNLTLNRELVHGNIGAAPIVHGTPHLTAGLELFGFGMQSAAIAAPVAGIFEPSAAMGGSPGHDYSQHASDPASANALEAGELTEPGVTPGSGADHNNTHSSHSTSASATEAAELVEPGVAPGDVGGHNNSQNASQSTSAKPSAAELAEPSDTQGHGNLQHPSDWVSVKALEVGELTEPGVTSGSGVGHNNTHSSHSTSASATEAAEPVEPSVASGDVGGHSNSQHASQSASAKPSAAELAEPSDTQGHGNSRHRSDSTSLKTSVAGELTEPDVTSGSGVDHNNTLSSYSTSASATEAVGPGGATGDGGGHGNSPQASHSASVKAAGGGELTEPSVTSGSGVGQNNSYSASASATQAAEPVEPGVAPGDGGSHGNSPQASHSASANPSADPSQPAETASAADGAGHEQAFLFKDQAPPSTAAVELDELNDLPVLLVQGAELAAILEIGPATMGEHATSHINSGQHQALAHLSHELLT